MKRLADAEQAGVAYAARAGAASIAEFRKFAPDKLPGGFGSGAAWPIIDGWVIPDDQFKLYEAGKYNDVAILIGYNSDEGSEFLREKTPGEFRANVEKRYGPFAEKLLAVYPVGSNTVPKTARDLMRDAAFGWHTWSWALLQARTGKSRYSTIISINIPTGRRTRRRPITAWRMAWMCPMCSKPWIATGPASPRQIWRFPRPLPLLG